MEWELVGKGLFCPAAVSRGTGDVLLLARVASGHVVSLEWRDGLWGDARTLAVPSAVPAEWPLAACSAGDGRVDAFARTPDGELLHLRGDGATFSHVELLGAPAAASPAGIVVPVGLTGTPAACSGAPDRVDVFAIGETGELLQTWNEDGQWSGFASLGVPGAGDGRSTPMAAALSACSCGSGRMAVFARGWRGDLMMKWWNGARWTEFESLGWPKVHDQTYPAAMAAAPLSGPPAACSWGRARMDVFARGPHGDVLHTGWDGREWSGFRSLGMPGGGERKRLASTGAVAACSWGPGRIDVFTRAVDGALYHRVWNGSEPS